MSGIVLTPPPEQGPMGTWTRRIFQRLVTWMDRPTAARFRLSVINAAPPKPTFGDIVLADGTNWNPGSGKGIYYYDGSAWNKL